MYEEKEGSHSYKGFNMSVLNALCEARSEILLVLACTANVHSHSAVRL